jgi:hypothetical protein
MVKPRKNREKWKVIIIIDIFVLMMRLGDEGNMIWMRKKRQIEKRMEKKNMASQQQTIRENLKFKSQSE